MKTGTAITAISMLILNTCIDPYYPTLKGYESIMVVNGLISDEDRSYIVKLSRTIQDQAVTPATIDDAEVTFTEDYGKIIHLQNCGGGIYKTDSLSFKGVPGRSYTLNILTADGKEYKSNNCLMKPVPEIDSVYYESDRQLVSNGTGSEEGLRIYVDSKSGPDDIFYRWSFEETWKFRLQNPKMYDFINAETILPVDTIRQICWKSMISSQVIIHGNPGQGSQIKKQPVYFIASAKSDRLMSEYSILVKQYSISRNEYEFWSNLYDVNETGDDIFASQPFSVISNIKNINNPEERVLGYFQVSAVTEKRIFISFNDFKKLGLPFYHVTGCERNEVSPAEFSSSYGPPMTFEKLYDMFAGSGYIFIEPVYSTENYSLEKLVFVKPECADCEITGFSVKPDFWITD